MKRTSISVLALLFCSLALADINLHYQQVIDGEAPLSEQAVDQIYDTFLAHYRSEIAQIPKYQ